MRIFPNTDEAMMQHERLDHVGRWLITIGQLLSQVGTRIVQGRNELLTEALDAETRRREAAQDALHEAYQAGRRDEHDGVPDIYADAGEDQGDEDQAVNEGQEDDWSHADPGRL